MEGKCRFCDLIEWAGRILLMKVCWVQARWLELRFMVWMASDTPPALDLWFVYLFNVQKRSCFSMFTIHRLCCCLDQAISYQWQQSNIRDPVFTCRFPLCEKWIRHRQMVPWNNLYYLGWVWLQTPLQEIQRKKWTNKTSDNYVTFYWNSIRGWLNSTWYCYFSYGSRFSKW